MRLKSNAKGLLPPTAAGSQKRRDVRLTCLLSACLAWLFPTYSPATPTITYSSDSHGSYDLINNGPLQFQLYTSGTYVGEVMSLMYQNQQMLGSKGLYDDIQGTPGIYFYSSTTQFSVRTGSNFVDVALEQPATATQPLDATLHYILQDGASGYSTYLTYHHTATMADYQATENRFAEFFNGNLFHYSSITNNYWGVQAAGNADRNQGNFITAETSNMEGIPSEYIKPYETKYDWHDTHADEGGITGIVTAANTSTSTAPISGTDFGVWNITNYRSNESWNGGPTQPQSVWADGASFIVSPAGSHQGGPTGVYTGNVDKSFGPYYTYFNTGSNINSMRADAAVQQASPNLNSFYDSLNLPYYASTSQRGTVDGQIRLADGSSLAGATIVLSTFDPTAYASDPISQEYQRRALGYNYWVTPSANGTFVLPDVRPGTYRVTIIKPGDYREGTFDNITVSAGATTNTGNLTWTPDVSGHGVFQIGTFDRSAAEFKAGSDYNNWLDTNNINKEFPNGVNYTVNPANPFNDTQNWKNNWPLYQMNPGSDFYTVNFPIASAPAANSTYTLTISLAGQEFINDLGALVNGTTNRVDASFDHTADNSSIVYRSDDTSGRVMYRKLSFPGTWLHAGNNTIQFHIVGGEMEWDAVRLDEQDAGTYSQSQWDGGTGNFSDASHWLTQPDGYTNVVPTGAPANSTNTTFAAGATHTAPLNNITSSLYYDATINGGIITLDTTAAVQKLSLLSGTLNVATGNPVLTANDAFVLAGGNFNGSGTINALTTTTVNFSSTISGGAKVNSTGAVTWNEGGTSITVTGNGSQWTTPGLSFGTTNTSSLAIASGGLVSTGTGALIIGSQGSLSNVAGTLTTTGISSAGSFNSSGSVATGTSVFNNSGTAVVNGSLSGAGIINTGGLLLLGGTNSYTGNTVINGGVVQFSSLSSIGGTGANVVVNSGGAVSFAAGITTAGFLARISPASTGSLALTAADSNTALNFSTGGLASLATMAVGAVGNVTYSGSYSPAGGIYRLGGGSGTLTYTPVITGANGVVIGGNGSGGAVVLNAANSYLGSTTLKGGTLQVSSLGNGGANSALGSSSNLAGNLIIDGGDLQATANATTDRLFTLGASGAIFDGSGGSLTFSNTAALATIASGNRLLTLTGSNLANSFAPAIIDSPSGTTGLTKTGAGTWTINSATSTYSGDTTVLSGTLALGPAASIPTGYDKGNLVVALHATFETNGGSLTINGLNDGPAGPSGPASANGNGGGSLDSATGPSTLTVGNGNAAGQFSGVISGNVSLVKIGSGTQILSGDNTYLGTTTISAGTLQIGVGGTPSSYGPGDGGFRGTVGAGAITNNATLVFNRGYLTTCTNPISGTGTLKQVANAELVLGSANTYTGPTLIGGGIANIGLGSGNQTGLAFSGDCSLNASVLVNGGVASSIGASSNNAANLILDGGTLYYTGNTTSTDRLFTVTENGGAIYASGGITFTNTGAIVMSGSGNRTLSLEGDTASTCTLNCDIGDPAAGGVTSLTKNRSGTWLLTSSSSLTYSGDTDMLMGKLMIGSGEALPYGPGKGNIVFGISPDFGSVYDPILEMNGNDLSINALTGAIAGYGSVDNNIGTHTLTLGNNNASGEFLGILTGGINLVKTGSGTETLDGVNTNTGSTAVSAGALIFSATSAIGGTGKNVTIANGATLGGPGTVVTQTFLARVSSASSGVLALTSADTGNLDFSASGANLAGVSLGAIGAVTYSGTITPYATNFELGGGGGVLTVSSALTGATSTLTIGAAGFANGAPGTVILTNTNTYGGATAVLAGTLEVTSAAGIGGSGASVTVSSGAVMAAGYAMDQAFVSRINPVSAGVIALAASSANSLSLAAAGLTGVSIGAVGSVTLTGAITPAGSSYHFGGGGGTLTIGTANLISGAMPVVVGLGAATPAGYANPLTLNVSTAQNYTGSTTIKTGGTLTGTLSNGGTAGALGASSNSAGNLIFDGGTLAAAGTTDRLFTLTANGGTLDNSGAMSFSNTASIATVSGTSPVLVLTGISTAHNTLSLSIANPGSGGILSITKTGSGKWTFNSGVKTYSGDTNVSAGTLETLSGNALSPNSNMVIGSGAYLDFHDSSPQSVNGLQGAGAVINSFSGSHTDTFTIGAAGGSGTFSGPISSAGTFNLIKAGSGTQLLSGNISFSGTTSVTGGWLTVDYAGSDTSTYLSDSAGATLNINGAFSSTVAITSNGFTTFGPSQNAGILNRTIGSLTVSANGVVSIAMPSAAANRTILVTGALTFGGGTNNWLGSLDLSGNDMVVLNGSLTNITNQLKAGYNGGHWSGSSGIVSSQAATALSNLTALGSAPGGFMFDNVSTATNDVVLKYTYYGDSNLDGVVDGTDYSRIDVGFLNHTTGWNNGDFNYDGVVDGSDYTLIDNAFNSQGTSLASIVESPAAVATGEIAASGSSPVPEPIKFVPVLALGVLSSRRRAGECRCGLVACRLVRLRV